MIDYEKARSELLIMPILLASRDRSRGCFAIYSGEPLEANADKGLNGECDFILIYTPPLPAIQSPIFTVVEAKKNAIESHWVRLFSINVLLITTHQGLLCLALCQYLQEA